MSVNEMTAETIQLITDWDTATTPGYYRSAYNAANIPPNLNVTEYFGQVINIPGNGSAVKIKQIVYSTQGNTCLTRTKNLYDGINGNWSAWEYINPQSVSFDGIGTSGSYRCIADISMHAISHDGVLTFAVIKSKRSTGIPSVGFGILTCKTYMNSATDDALIWEMNDGIGKEDIILHHPTNSYTKKLFIAVSPEYSTYNILPLNNFNNRFDGYEYLESVIRYYQGNTGETVTAATLNTSGTVTKPVYSADKTKLDSIATNANNYVHPTTSGYKHIPSGGSSGQVLKWSANGTAAWGNIEGDQYNRVTVEFSTPDNRGKLYNLVNDFLAGTGQYANTAYKTLYVTVKGSNPCIGSPPDFGTGTDADPYCYFKFATPASTTRKAKVVIDWSGLDLTFNYSSTTTVLAFFKHDLASTSTVHHFNFNTVNSYQKGCICYMNGQGTVIFENSTIDGTATTSGTDYSTLFHAGTGTVELLNTEVNGSSNAKPVWCQGGGTLKASDSKFLSHNYMLDVIYSGQNNSGGAMILNNCLIHNDDDGINRGISNDSGVLFATGCQIDYLYNKGTAHVDNCEILQRCFSTGPNLYLNNSRLKNSLSVGGGKAFVSNCHIIDETSINGISSAVKLYNVGSLFMTNTTCEFIGTYANSDAGTIGAAVYIDSGTDVLKYRCFQAVNCTFAGAKSASNTAGKGVGIYVRPSYGCANDNLTLLGCRFVTPSSGVNTDDIFMGFKEGVDTYTPNFHIQGNTFRQEHLTINGQAVTDITPQIYAMQYLPELGNLYAQTRI